MHEPACEHLLRRTTVMKRKITSLALVALMGLSLTGCASGTFEDDGSSSGERAYQSDVDEGLFEQEIVLSDGRTVTCIVFAAYSKGGVSCDWDGASE